MMGGKMGKCEVWEEKVAADPTLLRVHAGCSLGCPGSGALGGREVRLKGS